ncbi:MAG: hypothetical protein QM398_11955 [Thermoproteota archaeon]|nr:hypothetical protein [Thermoproteota archaeon]
MTEKDQGNPNKNIQQIFDEVLFYKRKQANLEFQTLNTGSYVGANILAWIWYTTAIFSFLGLALIISNIEYSVGVLLSVWGTLSTIFTCALNQLLSRYLSKEQKKYVDKIVELTEKTFTQKIGEKQR